jgi:hypothetical protein
MFGMPSREIRHTIDSTFFLLLHVHHYHHHHLLLLLLRLLHRPPAPQLLGLSERLLLGPSTAVSVQNLPERFPRSK